MSEDALEFFRHNHRAVLATYRRDGRAQMSPIVQAVGNDGRILISTTAASAKVRNIKRDPRVSICALTNGFFGGSAQIDGTASITPLPEAMPTLRFVYEQISGPHPDWDEFERHMVAQVRVVVAITPGGPGPAPGA